jgi:hypothetical protein
MAGRVWMCEPCAPLHAVGDWWGDSGYSCSKGRCGVCDRWPAHVRYCAARGESCNPAGGAGRASTAAAPIPRSVAASPPAPRGAPRSVEKEGAGSQIELFG